MFNEWNRRWMVPARYEGPFVPDEAERTNTLRQLWQEAIPGAWQRGVDQQLHGNPYRRGDRSAPHAGEHAIEHAILGANFESIKCFGDSIRDGVNAMPLARSGTGGRSDNVEADLLLLTEGAGGHRLFLCEVKEGSNNAWYAAIENLRQLKLFTSSPQARRVFLERCPSLSFPVDPPVTGIVLAPSSFYSSNGQKANSVVPAMRLLERFNAEFKLDMHLAVWDPALHRIDRLVR